MTADSGAPLFLRRTVTVALPWWPLLFTLEECWNCRVHMFPSRLGGILAVTGRFCKGCRRNLTRALKPGDMGFEVTTSQEMENAESINPRPDAGGRGAGPSLRGAPGSAVFRTGIGCASEGGPGGSVHAPADVERGAWPEDARPAERTVAPASLAGFLW